MSGASCAIRGMFFDFKDNPWRYVGHEQDAARFFPDGLLVVKDGVIADFGTFADVSRRHPDLPVTHLQNRSILPGFIDGHIHFPQVRVLGAYGNQLLDWLHTWIFPEEVKYRDRDYSRTAARFSFGALLAGGTMLCLAFTTETWVAGKRAYSKSGGPEHA